MATAKTAQHRLPPKSIRRTTRARGSRCRRQDEPQALAPHEPLSPNCKKPSLPAAMPRKAEAPRRRAALKKSAGVEAEPPRTESCRRRGRGIGRAEWLRSRRRRSRKPPLRRPPRRSVAAIEDEEPPPAQADTVTDEPEPAAMEAAPETDETADASRPSEAADPKPAARAGTPLTRARRRPAPKRLKKRRILLRRRHSGSKPLTRQRNWSRLTNQRLKLNRHPKAYPRV